MTLHPEMPRTRRTRYAAGTASSAIALFGAGLLIFSASPVQAAATVVPLGTAKTYSVLAASTVTNTGTTTVDGNVGVYPGPAISDLGNLIVGGVEHVADAHAAQAQLDLDAAYGNAAGQGPVTDVDTELGGETLVGGVYGNETLGLTGTLPSTAPTTRTRCGSSRPGQL